MSKITAGITISVDGYITGPDDGPGQGLGVGGERLHSWVFGGPWSYSSSERGSPLPEDEAWLNQSVATLGAVICGRGTYEAADHWGGTTPWGVRFIVVTYRPEEQPAGGGFVFAGSIPTALEQATAAAGAKDVHVMGGADVIRQCLDAGALEGLTIIIAPVILGGGKRLFEGFTRDIELEHLGVRQSRFATFLDYRVVR